MTHRFRLLNGSGFGVNCPGRIRLATKTLPVLQHHRSECCEASVQDLQLIGKRLCWTRAAAGLRPDKTPCRADQSVGRLISQTGQRTYRTLRPPKPRRPVPTYKSVVLLLRCHTMSLWYGLVRNADQPRLSAPAEAQASAAEPWSLGLDDGTGVRVARSAFQGDLKFSWDLFRGFRSCQVLTYSIDLATVRRLITDLGVAKVECVIGTVATIDRIEKVLAVQQAAMQHASILVEELSKTACDVIEALTSGQLAFWVLRDQVSHSKLYLLDGGTEPERRIIMGSANFSEQAFRGWQHETLAMYDDDPAAWDYYSARYREVRDRASQRIDPQLLLGRTQPVQVEETPVLAGERPSIVLVGGDSPSVEDATDSIRKTAKTLRNQIGPHLPARRRDTQTLNPDLKTRIRGVLRNQPRRATEPAAFSISTDTRTATFDGTPFPLDFDPELAVSDAELMIEYFTGFEGFAGTAEEVRELQEEYFAFWAWLYFSPFMCDLRTRAAHANRDVIRYERVALLYGKANCGKTSLIQVLLRSMFPQRPQAAWMDRSLFKTAELEAITRTAKRCPAFFDDVTAKQMGLTGKDFIKNETPLSLAEYPAVVISMNRYKDGFADEIMKRAFLIYTHTALAVYNDKIREDEDQRIRKVADRLTGHLYRRYLQAVLDKLADDPLPDDWLQLSSGVLGGLLRDATAECPPVWSAPQTRTHHAERRYKSLRAKFHHLLRPAAQIDADNPKSEGWWVDTDTGRLIVRERVNQYGRSAFNWDQVPSTIIDADASSSGHTSLVLSELNRFLPNWNLHSPIQVRTPKIEQPRIRPRRRSWRLLRRASRG